MNDKLQIANRGVRPVRLRTFAAISSLCLILGGCHKQPRVAALPAAPPSLPTPAVTVPPPTHHTDEISLEPSTAGDTTTTPEKPKPRPRPRRPAPPKNSQVAVNTPPPTPSVEAATIGQLSTGSEVSNQTRQLVETLLLNVQKRLGDLSSDTQNAHRDQVERVRLFLKQAQDAWKSGDVEGTRTLATKANVLLDDILR